MNPITTERVQATNDMVLMQSVVGSLDRVEQILVDELTDKAPFVDELLRYVAGLGGKRLRPALVLLSANVAGEVNRHHPVLAAVLEMIHIATLVHDDVLDDAQTRRHRTSINARWGNESSVLLGDYLFTHSFYLASMLPSTFYCRTIGHATNVVCAGELRQVGNRGNFGLTEQEYLKIIDTKTAALCSCCCLLGAHAAGASEDECRCLELYGKKLGLAFQIADDLLDLNGEEQLTGKSLGSDLAKQKLTLPMIHLLRHVGREERKKIVDLIKTACPPHEIRMCLLPRLEEHGSLEYTRRMATRFAQQATGHLERFDASPARENLWQIAELAAERSH